ncbi:GNAT family N-acetyltransferase [Thalassotalea sp. G2M2-11]|uniref:GNAT family N-acetyltransferase n=1 Tax=Thalassotalea sp. G2M2-11 TaxID=2787627 RepID=UPI0019D28527|nr:GNAT family N-acetyltransferase [Thalassotalea sp. G2M2-11]
MKIILADKTDKKSVLRFYKQQHYSARYLGFDHVYIIEYDNNIIAAVMVSNIKPNANVSLLHALVVDKAYQRQGLATKLLQHVFKHHGTIICFAQPFLAPLYQSVAMATLTLAQIEQQLSPELYLRYLAYKKSQPKLQVFQN